MENDRKEDEGQIIPVNTHHSETVSDALKAEKHEDELLLEAGDTPEKITAGDSDTSSVAEPTPATATPAPSVATAETASPQPLPIAPAAKGGIFNIDRTNLNKYFLYTLIGGLVISALISVIAVLIGDFNSTMARALGTTASMVFHTLAGLLIASISSKVSHKARAGGFLVNALLVIILASFVTSILGTWDIISGQLNWDLYQVYSYSLLTVLWVQLLLKVDDNPLDKPTHIASQVSIGFTALFYLLLLPTVFTHFPDRLPDFFYRSLAATSIALATASVITTVLYRVYRFKHHNEPTAYPKSQGWDIVLACITLVIGLPIIIGLIASVALYNIRTDNSNQSVDNNESRVSQVEGDIPTENSSTTENSSQTVECIKASEQSKHPELKDIDVEFFDSNDTDYNRIATRMSTAPKATTHYSYYKVSPTVYDADCAPTTVDTLKSNDEVRLYYSDYDSYNGTFLFVQKLAK